MSSIIGVIEKLQDLRCLVPLSEKDIDEAEKVLGLKFADEYRTYTKKFGAISADGFELTGVVAAPRLNVVNVTASEKSLNQNIPGIFQKTHYNLCSTSKSVKWHHSMASLTCRYMTRATRVSY